MLVFKYADVLADVKLMDGVQRWATEDFLMLLSYWIVLEAHIIVQAGTSYLQLATTACSILIESDENFSTIPTLIKRYQTRISC